MSQLSSDSELDGPWDEQSLKTDLKNLEAYKKQGLELYPWVKANFPTMKRVAGIYGIDMNDLTEEAINSVPNMAHVLREGFYRFLEWYTLVQRCRQLIEYQAQQKRKKPYGIVIAAGNRFLKLTVGTTFMQRFQWWWLIFLAPAVLLMAYLVFALVAMVAMKQFDGETVACIVSAILLLLAGLAKAEECKEKISNMGEMMNCDRQETAAIPSKPLIKETEILQAEQRRLLEEAESMRQRDADARRSVTEFNKLVAAHEAEKRAWTARQDWRNAVAAAKLKVINDKKEAAAAELKIINNKKEAAAADLKVIKDKQEAAIATLESTSAVIKEAKGN